MKHEKSCGIIPIINNDGKTKVVLIKQNNGVIGFPKGHVESNETEEQTALRECLEETGLKAKIVGGFKEEITYFMEEHNAYKTVVFFVGMVDDPNFHKQESEINDIYLVEVEEALNLITFDATKELLLKALAFLKNR